LLQKHTEVCWLAEEVKIRREKNVIPYVKKKPIIKPLPYKLPSCPVREMCSDVYKSAQLHMSACCAWSACVNNVAEHTTCTYANIIITSSLP
uniref:Uncharacterized protein n=1 Tax=Glossina palpalis gambiensis TaxID=67801 RepID=A0A1B0AQ15_9MUSC